MKKTKITPLLVVFLLMATMLSCNLLTTTPPAQPITVQVDQPEAPRTIPTITPNQLDFYYPLKIARVYFYMSGQCDQSIFTGGRYLELESHDKGQPIDEEALMAELKSRCIAEENMRLDFGSIEFAVDIYVVGNEHEIFRYSYLKKEMWERLNTGQRCRGYIPPSGNVKTTWEDCITP